MMDSFYEQPRSVPVPINIEKTASSPHVPDVSLIFTQNQTQNKVPQFKDSCSSYNLWKARKEQSRCGGPYEADKENSCGFKAQGFSRKQVRFTGPVLQQNLNSAANNSSDCIKQSSFEQIYIANIPNRHLDLSLIEPPRPTRQDAVKQMQVESPCKFYGGGEENARQCTEPVPLKFRRNFTDSVKPTTGINNDYTVAKNCDTNLRLPSMEIYATKPSSNYVNSEMPLRKLQETKQKVDDEPTVKDLLKIIQQQSEQMILLQKQVASLLESKNTQKQIEDTPPIITQGLNTAAQFETGSVFNKKLAIDVMTSFEVSIRQNFPHRGKFLKDLNYEPKIQEITETSFDKDESKSGNVLDGIRPETKQTNSTDDTLILNESVKIPEESPSPEHSIHVDMQDYSSDSDSDVDSVDIGWTIYNNVMGQVNNILKKTTNSKPSHAGTKKTKEDKTMQRVKQATLQHLKSLGVTASDSDNPSEPSASEYTPSEISFAVKQLLLKYLPDDQLAKIMQRQSNEGAEFVKRRPEFSFATLQYMKKYNLLNTGNPDAPGGLTPVKADLRQDGNNPKILDVTALKQQPKLL